MKNIIYFLIGHSLSLSANSSINFLTPGGEIITQEKNEQTIEINNDNDEIVIDVVPDYHFNNLYVVHGQIEEPSSISVIDLTRLKVVSKIPGMYSINMPVDKNAPYFVASQLGTQYFSEAPKVEIRSRRTPQIIVAKNIIPFSPSLSLSFSVLVKDCFDRETSKFYESWKSRPSFGIDFQVDRSEAIKGDQIGGRWPDGIRWNLRHEKSKPWKLGLSTWEPNRWTDWSADYFNPMRSFGDIDKIIIPDLEAEQKSRIPTLRIFDFTLDQSKIITAKTELSDGENVLFFSGLSKDRLRAYYIAGHYTIRERKRYSAQLFRLSKQRGNWILDQVDVSKATASYEKEFKRKFGIRWVLDGK